MSPVLRARGKLAGVLVLVIGIGTLSVALISENTTERWGIFIIGIGLILYSIKYFR
jgi:Na+/phosphate symporter